MIHGSDLMFRRFHLIHVHLCYFSSLKTVHRCSPGSVFHRQQPPVRCRRQWLHSSRSSASFKSCEWFLVQAFVSFGEIEMLGLAGQLMSRSPVKYQTTKLHHPRVRCCQLDSIRRIDSMTLKDNGDIQRLREAMSKFLLLPVNNSFPRAPR